MPYSPQTLALLDETLHRMQQKKLVRVFPPELESPFQLDRLPTRFAMYRETMTLGIFLFNLFLIPDYLLLPSEFRLSLLLRLGVNTPLALLAIPAISRVKRGIREILFAVSSIPATLTVLYLSFNSADHIACAQVVVCMMMLFAINALRPDFRYACVSTPLLALGDTLWLCFTPHLSPELRLVHICLTWTAMGMSLLSCRRLEREERIAWLLRQRIARQNLALEHINKELTSLSQIDPLTGILNRRAFNNEFRSAWDNAIRKQQSLAALMMDLDLFKELNDNFGHECGDRVLIEAAHIMQNALRAECDVLARYGGEEFIALLPGQTLENAQRTAQRLCNAVHQSQIPCPPCGEMQNVSISIGVAATLPDGTQHATDLLSAADTQLYLAKDAGRNRIHPPLKPEIPL